MITFAYSLHRHKDAAFIYFQFRQKSSPKKKAYWGLRKANASQKKNELWHLIYDIFTKIRKKHLALIDKTRTHAEMFIVSSMKTWKSKFTLIFVFNILDYSNSYLIGCYA